MTNATSPPQRGPGLLDEVDVDPPNETPPTDGGGDDDDPATNELARSDASIDGERAHIARLAFLAALLSAFVAGSIVLATIYDPSYAIPNEIELNAANNSLVLYFLVAFGLKLTLLAGLSLALFHIGRSMLRPLAHRLAIVRAKGGKASDAGPRGSTMRIGNVSVTFHADDD